MDTNHPADERPRAIPFIVFNESSGFKVTAEAVQFLRGLSSERLGIISMVGKYRTGKSYFINKVLLDLEPRSEGFAVGPTVNPCTKGLWLWNRTIPAAQFGGEADLDLLVLDTEGFGGVDEGVNHDTRIFLFSILLSSYFIYNSVGAIDENALQSLAMIINIAKDIKVKAFGQDSEEDIARTFPSFLWVVRDFILSIEDTKGAHITPKQYLENALAPLKGMSSQTEAKNRTRKYFRQFFQNRDCLTLVRPAKNERDLRSLESLTDGELREEFLIEMRAAREKIFRTVRAKTIDGRNVTGPLLLEAVGGYVEAVNAGKVPNIEQIWSYACQEASRNAFQDSLRLMDKMLAGRRGELRSDGLTAEAKRQIEREVLREFKRQAVGDKKALEAMREKLEEAMGERLESFKRAQKRDVEKELQESLERKTAAIRNQVIANALKSPKEVHQQFEALGAEMLGDSGGPEGSWRRELTGRILAQREKEILQMMLARQTESEQADSQRLATLTAELETLKSRVRSLEAENDELKSGTTRVQQRARALADESEELKRRLDASKIECQEKLFQLKQLQNDVDLRRGREHAEGEAATRTLRAELERILLEHEREKAELKKAANLAAQQLELYKLELQRKDEGSHSLQKECERLREQAREQDLRLQRAEAQPPRNDGELREVREQLARAEGTVMELKMSRQYLSDQLEFYKQQTEDSRKLYEKLILNASAQRNSGDSGAQSDLLATNKTLSASLSKLQSKNKTLEEHIQFLKPFKRILKHAAGVQCQKCGKVVNAGLFISHVEDCSVSQNFDKSSPSLQNVPGISAQLDPSARDLPRQSVLSPVSARIDKTIINNEGSRPIIQYVLQVSCEERTWQVKRKYKEFCDLYNVLSEENPGIVMPKSCRVIQEFYTNINKILANQKPAIEDRKNSLQAFINDLALIPQIRASRAFKAFLEIEDLPALVPLPSLERRGSAIAKEGPGRSKELNENRESLNYRNTKGENPPPREGLWGEQTNLQSISINDGADLRDDYGSEIPTPENPPANPNHQRFYSLKNDGNLGFTNKSLHNRLFMN